MRLPAIRKLILPDKDHILFDCDMAGADAQVVAWEAEDEELKEAFRKGLKIHVKNFEDFYQKPFEPKYKVEVAPGHLYPPYDEMKRAVHATNYYAKPPTLSATLQWTRREAENFQRRWFELHPGIREWHQRIERQVQLTRSVENRFGYRITYFGRVEEVLPQALAWIPQSSVAILAAKAGVALDDAYGFGAVRSGRLRERKVTILLQVHDSLVFQIHRRHLYGTAGKQLLEGVKACLHIPIPYPDPLRIQWAIAASPTSWGDVKDTTWDEAYKLAA